MSGIHLGVNQGTIRISLKKEGRGRDRERERKREREMIPLSLLI
jgi:hypothetical protein